MNADIGLIGLAVMGENLALNLESRGFIVALYNRMAPGEEKIVEHFIQGRGQGKHFIRSSSIKQLVEEVKLPRRILLMVKAGRPVDDLLEQLIPFLSPGDIIIDGGNSNYHDTERHVKQMEAKGFYFVGTGISGGEIGALQGPSIMPGGSVQAWPFVKPILQQIAAKLPDGTPCCDWIGPGGAGHYVKMVHNGIEYGNMQLIAEAYLLLRRMNGLDYEELANLFETWNQGELNSYLMEITAQIFRARDKDGSYLLNKILDVAEQKGTGQWSVISALNEREPFSLISEAVQARFLSALKEERKQASDFYKEKKQKSSQVLPVDSIRQTLYLAKMISYAQGFSLLRRASIHYNWNLNYCSIARIWQKGCIIRARLLQEIQRAFNQKPNLENLLFDTFFQERIKKALSVWREVVSTGILAGIALPAMSAALNYFHGLCTQHSAAHMIQAQRDFFGAHQYERVDYKRGYFFHTQWTSEDSE